MNGSEVHYTNGHTEGNPLPTRANLYDYLIVLARHRLALAVIVIGGTLLVAAATFVMPHTYVASATLLPPDKSDGISLTSLIQRNTGFDLQAFGENASAEIFVKILNSRTLVDSLIDRFDVMERLKLAPNQRQIAQQTVVGNFDVTADRHGVITIGYTEETGFMPGAEEQRDAAEFSAKMVNAAIELLDNLNRQKNVSRARRTREYIGRMKEVKRAELDSAQRSLLEFQRANKAISLDDQIQASVTALAETQAQIQKKEIELNTALNEMSADAGMVNNLRTALSNLRQQKTRLESGAAGGDALGLDLRNLPDVLRQYANHKLDLEIAAEVYTFLEAQYNHEQVQEARDLPTVNVLDPAVPPTLRASPRRTVTMLIAVPILAIVALLYIFIYDSLSRQWRAGDTDRGAELRAALGRRRKHIPVKTS